MDLFRRHALPPRLALLALIAATPVAGLAQQKEGDPTPSAIGIGSRVRYTEPGRHGLLLRKRHVVGTVIAADETVSYTHLTLPTSDLV